MGFNRGKTGLGAEQLWVRGSWAGGRWHRCSNTLKSAGSRCGGTFLKHSPDVRVGEPQKLQGVEVTGDVEMLGCNLASGDGVGTWFPSPLLPLLGGQAVGLPRLQRCTANGNVEGAQLWLARGSSRGLCSVGRNEACPVSYTSMN